MNVTLASLVFVGRSGEQWNDCALFIETALGILSTRRANDGLAGRSGYDPQIRLACVDRR